MIRAGTAAFATESVGTGKPVTVTLTLGGAAASNYSVAATAPATADITAKALTANE